jgi:hypothetical protein
MDEGIIAEASRHVGAYGTRNQGAEEQPEALVPEHRHGGNRQELQQAQNTLALI